MIRAIRKVWLRPKDETILGGKGKEDWQFSDSLSLQVSSFRYQLLFRLPVRGEGTVP
jgi:hypothetical protein